MPDIAEDSLVQLSAALAERARLARPLVAVITGPGRRMRSAIFWRKDVVVASEQACPDIEKATVTAADGSAFAARVAGRDLGTNIIAFRLHGGPDPARRPAAEPQPGALALVFGGGEGGVSVRLGAISSVGPSWHSRAGGRIDRRVILDIAMTRREEGGPVLDAGGGLLGISTFSPQGAVMVIPSTTIEDVIEPLLSKGRVERGWLGVALQPVLVPDSLQSEAGQARGLMIMGVAKDGPAAQGGMQAGDILLAVGSQRVHSPALVAQCLGQDSVGRQIELRLIRAGTLQTLAAKVGVRPPR